MPWAVPRYFSELCFMPSARNRLKMHLRKMHVEQSRGQEIWITEKRDCLLEPMAHSCYLDSLGLKELVLRCMMVKECSLANSRPLG
jgi:hypothetical protein